MQQDLFAFEIFNGHLYLHADLGSGPVKVKSSKQRIDDGTWHDVALRRVERDGRVTVDGSIVEFRTPGKQQNLCLLFLASFFFLFFFFFFVKFSDSFVRMFGVYRLIYGLQAEL